LFTQAGEEVHDIPVVPGETVRLRIDNTVGFPISFFIGSDEELNAPNATTDVGIPEWSDEVRELTWDVPDDISGLRFGSTLPGHYERMYGCFSAGHVGPDGTVERDAEADPCSPSVVVHGLDPRLGGGGRIVVPEARFAVTVPSHWQHLTDADVRLALFGDDAACTVSFEVERPFHAGWEVPRIEGIEFEVHPVTVGGQRAIRTDYELPLVDIDGQQSHADASTYDVVSPDGWHYVFDCNAPQSPSDHWLSIAETFEFLPDDGS
jgi:hypothetical protein